MNKNLKIYKIDHHTQEWYDFRLNGIGGSEIGTLMGINKYDTNLRLFHEKIGSEEPRRLDNERMFWGRKNEANIADVWQYYDGTKDGYLENYKNNKIVRKCRSIHGYVVNPKYPWLFASVDRLINIEGGFNLVTGKPFNTEAILECKNMGYWMSKIWDDGMPIYNLAQIHQYMAILETDYAEIAMLVDGGNLVVEKIVRDDVLIKRLLSISKMWWYNRVVPGKEAVRKRNLADMEGNIAESEKWDAEIQRVEPEPDRSEEYTEFMEERFVKERQTVDGTMALYSQARRDNFLRALQNLVEKERNGIKNLFIKYLSQNGAESVDFGRLGYTNWSFRRGAKARVFNNRTKEAPKDDYVEDEFLKLDQNGF